MSTTSSLPIRIHQPDWGCVFDESVVRNLPDFERLDRAFQAATGWSLGYHESNVSRQRRVRSNCPDFPIFGSLCIADLSTELPPGASACSRQKCDEFVAALNEMLRAFDETREENWLLQADLAANVPMAMCAGARRELSHKLTHLLNRIAQRADAFAALLYLLDDQGETLNLRAHCGMGNDPGRWQKRLQASPIDVRALLGETVEINNLADLKLDLPASCHVAQCAPIHGHRKPIGTLWLLRNESKKQSAEPTDELSLLQQQIGLQLENATLLREIDHLRKSAHWQSHEVDPGYLPQQLRFDRLSVTQISANSQGTRSTGSWHIDGQGQITAAHMSAGNTITEPHTQRLVSEACFQSLAMTTMSLGDLVSCFRQVAGRAVSGDSDVAIIACTLDPLTGRARHARSGYSNVLVLRDGATRVAQSQMTDSLEFDVGRREHLFLTTMNATATQLSKAIDRAAEKGKSRLSHEQWVETLNGLQVSASGRMEPCHGVLMSRV